MPKLPQTRLEHQLEIFVNSRNLPQAQATRAEFRARREM